MARRYGAGEGYLNGYLETKMVRIFVPTSPGELLDRITILEIKVKDQPQLQEDLTSLQKVAEKILNEDDLYFKLKSVNRQLWNVENIIRQRMLIVDDGLVADAARSIVTLNDKRSSIKQEINKLYGSEFQDEKFYS